VGKKNPEGAGRAAELTHWQKLLVQVRFGGQVPKLLLPAVPHNKPQSQAIAWLPLPVPGPKIAHAGVAVVMECCCAQIAFPPVGGVGCAPDPLIKQSALPAVPPGAHALVPQDSVQKKAVFKLVQTGSLLGQAAVFGLPPLPVQSLPIPVAPPGPSRNTLLSLKTFASVCVLLLLLHAMIVVPTPTPMTMAALKKRDVYMRFPPSPDTTMRSGAGAMAAPRNL
jgi:hypothetical protein